MSNIIHYRGFSLYHHENNPGHWLHNDEIWAAQGHQEKVVQENGYVRAPWRQIASEHAYLDFLDTDKATRDKVDAWLLAAFGNEIVAQAARNLATKKIGFSEFKRIVRENS